MGLFYMPQSTAKIVQKSKDVEDRLAAFDVTKDELLRVVHAAVAARNDFLPIDPINAAGQLSYIFGTRALRDLFGPKGWLIDRTDNIESTYSAELGVKIIFQNATCAGDVLRDPRAVSDKGPAAVRAVDLGQYSLFPELEEEERLEAEKADAAIWYLFVAVDGEKVTAELSCPKEIAEKQFRGFHERILVLQAGEWSAMLAPAEESELPDFDVEVTRKK